MARRSVDGTPSAWSKNKYSLGATTSKNTAPPLTLTGGEEEQRPDYISALPDELLLQIIALLPTKAGGRTQVLASRWNRLWWSLPLNLQCHGSADGATANLLDLDHPGENITSSAMTYILATHPGPGRCLRLPASYLQPRRRIPERFLPARVVPPLDTWLNSRALDGLQEIEFYPTKPVLAPLPVLPPTVLRFACSLRVASFSQCSLPEGNCRLQFLNLRKLGIDDVISSEFTIHRLIAGCPNLECLLIKGTVGFRSLTMESHTLRTLAVSVASRQRGQTLDRITILNAPSLEIFLRLGEDTKKLDVTVVDAPILSTFGPLVDVQGAVTKYFIDSAVVSGLRISSKSLVVASVKMIFICTQPRHDFTAEAPEILPIPREAVHKVPRWGIWGKVVQGLDLKLKKIVLSGYIGSEDQFVFARYFMENAFMLQKMMLVFPRGFDANPSWMEDQDRRMRRRTRAASDSPVVEFSTRKCQRNGLHVQDVHSMSASDPFDCSCGC